ELAPDPRPRLIGDQGVRHGGRYIATARRGSRADLTPRPPSLGGKGVPWAGSVSEPVGVLQRTGYDSVSEEGTPFLPREGGRGVRSTARPRTGTVLSPLLRCVDTGRAGGALPEPGSRSAPKS